jgi:hypothetical protein
MDVRMVRLKDSEDFVGKSLTNAGNTLKVKKNFLEAIQSSDNPLRLRSRNQVLIPVLR